MISAALLPSSRSGQSRGHASSSGVPPALFPFGTGARQHSRHAQSPQIGGQRNNDAWGSPRRYLSGRLIGKGTHQGRGQTVADAPPTQLTTSNRFPTLETYGVGRPENWKSQPEKGARLWRRLGTSSGSTRANVGPLKITKRASCFCHDCSGGAGGGFAQFTTARPDRSERRSGRTSISYWGWRVTNIRICRLGLLALRDFFSREIRLFLAVNFLNLARQLVRDASVMAPEIKGTDLSSEMMEHA